AAHAALAGCYSWVLVDFQPDFTKAREHAQKALALNERVAEAHKVLGWVKWVVDWDGPGCVKEFSRAIELEPRNPSLHENYGVALRGMGRLEDAIAHLKLAQQLDQGSLTTSALLGGCYMLAHENELAIEELQKVIVMETNAPVLAYLTLAEVYENKQDFTN